jgi:hypothetical protein
MATDGRVDADVTMFLRLDTEIKRANKQMKGVRATLKECRERIIAYMVSTKTDKLVGINNGTQYLECVSKTMKQRPTAEQMINALDAAIKANITDPAKLVEIVQNAGGTHEEYRLSRRTRRVNAVSALAAIAAAGEGHKPPAKKRKLDTADG